MYISLFPQLIAGPIVRYTTIEEQIENIRYCIDNIETAQFDIEEYCDY